MDHAHATTTSPGVRLAPRSASRAAPAPAPALAVDLLRSRAAFDALAPEWDALVARSGDDQLFYRHWFLGVWLDHFGADATLRVATLRDGGGRLTAVLPLLWRRQRLHGVPVRALCSMGNLHSCRFDLVAEDPGRAAPALLARLLQERDWDLLQLADVPPGGRAHALAGAAAAAGLRSGRWDSIVSPFVRLPTHWEVFERGLGNKARTALRRRRQRVAANGQLAVERIAGGPRLQPCLDEALALEAAGWKGRAGTAIRNDPATLGFYTGLAHAAAERGALALWMLRIDGRAVAFQLALEHRGRGLLLKQGYDETFREFGPGQLLMEDVLRDGSQRGMSEFDLLGDDAPAKRVWAGNARRHQWLFVFRGARGRLVHALKFVVAPPLRRLRARLRPH